MGVCKHENMYIDTLINSEINNKSKYLSDKSFVVIMSKLKKNIELVSELGLLEEFNKDILDLITSKDISSQNLILNYNNICENNNNENLVKIFEFLNSQSICIVVEPNKNMYLSLDYSSIISKMHWHISPGANKGLLLHKKVQETALVNANNEVLTKDIMSFRQEVLIDCDFEKNETLFSYFCEALDIIDLGVHVYTLLK